ncbi:MAG: Fur family transcriptional regulator [Candidatus Moraniibacteriota bacterium]
MIDTCSAKLAQNRIRPTETRQVILAILHAAVSPLSPPDIVTRCHAAGRRANKTTIYRDLVRMEGVGVVRKVIVSDRKQYFELTERGHHHHFVCTSCEKIHDVDLEEDAVLKRAKQIGKKSGFMISSHALEFFGRCADCLIVAA